jgi:Na+/H+ antiporter NhaC
MRYDIRHLQAFLVVADTLHFGRAAASCFVTQPTLSVGAAPEPVTMTCWGFMPATIASSMRAPPMIAPIAESLAMSSRVSTGEVSSSRAIIVASISTCPLSPVPMSMIMSRYLAGPRQFQPWNR